MVDQNTDFFKIVDNFAKTAHIPSIPIIKATLGFVPKVTIAIPTYKRPELLKETIDSALNQRDFENYEIVVVDNDPELNCSTHKMMDLYQSKNISYYKNSENIGMVGNWNRCFEIAKTEYVVLLHDDDLVDSNFLNKCWPIIESQRNVGILKSLFKTEISDNNKTIKKAKTLRMFDFENFFGAFLGAPTGCFFKVEYVKKLGGFNDALFPTFDFCFIVLFSKYYKVLQYNNELISYGVGDNESMKIDTIKRFFHNDTFFQSQLMKQYFVPAFIIKSVLTIRFLDLIKMYQNIYNKNFSLDMKELNLKNEYHFLDYLNYRILLMYFFTLRFFFNLKARLFE
jgi:glycosyltransferase involved in cell wall biosynthesis